MRNLKTRAERALGDRAITGECLSVPRWGASYGGARASIEAFENPLTKAKEAKKSNLFQSHESLHFGRDLSLSRAPRIDQTGGFPLVAEMPLQ